MEYRFDTRSLKSFPGCRESCTCGRKESSQEEGVKLGSQWQLWREAQGGSGSLRRC